MHRDRVLIVDLNNFSTFPTLAVGILIASLRNSGCEVQLLSPLAHDVPATEREKAENYFDHIARRVHLSTWSPFRSTRDKIRSLRSLWLNRPHPRVLSETAKALRTRPDAILLSAYLQHYSTVSEIGKMARTAGIPILLGGPAFTIQATAEHWRHIPGLTALVGGEVDLVLPEMVRVLRAGGDLLKFEGVVLPDGRRSAPARPLRSLDLIPVPDFTDFPWDRYRVRIIPLMAGRGCQWNRCNFCSDIVSASGRTFRSRSIDMIMHEMREQARRHATSNFLFLDLKLNSNPAIFRGIVEGVQRNVRNAEWIGTVHVDQRRDNGLTRSDLNAAVAAGMRRVSFGLESGSQRMLDAMDKGCSVEANSEFIRHAYEAGLSVRCTMFKGFPGETANDMELTAKFLEQHGNYLDRVRFNEFSIPAGTLIDRALRESPEQFSSIRALRINDRDARVEYINVETNGRAYRKAKRRALKMVYKINSRRIRSAAEAFDGLM